jgi:hypothetical protein
MKVFIALAASPLTELHLPQTFDLKSLRHHLVDIPEFRQGKIKWEVHYDSVGNSKPHHSARVQLTGDMGTGWLELVLGERAWHYTGETVINGETTDYEGDTAHSSIQSACRKVRGMAQMLL